MEKPRYVERDNEIIYRPPFLQADTTLTAWMVKGDRAAMQAVIDQQLNQPSGGKPYTYKALLSHAMFVLADIPQVRSTDPRDAQRGWCAETDVCFWILTAAYVGDQIDHIAWFIPYIWVDSPYTQANGREVFGFGKSFANAVMPKDPTDPGPFTAQGLVLPTYTPQTEVQYAPLFTMGRDPDATLNDLETFGPDDRVKAFTAIAKRISDVGETLCGDWKFILSLIEDALGKHLPMVFLKQFRDCVDPTAACYQAIIESNSTIQGFSGAGFLPLGWHMKLFPYASVDMGKYLGIANEVDVDLGFWVKFTFSIDLGKEVWRAP